MSAIGFETGQQSGSGERGEMHELWQQALLGAAGGLLVGLVEFYNRLIAWRTRRRQRSAARMRFRQFFDVGPDIAVTVTRATLGAFAGLAFGTGGQVTGIYGLLTVGASAPALLAQLGQVKSIRDVLTSEDEGPPSSLVATKGSNIQMATDESQLEKSLREAARDA